MYSMSKIEKSLKKEIIMSSHSHLFGNLLPPIDGGEGPIMGRKSQLNCSRFTTNFCVPENEFQCNCTFCLDDHLKKKMVPTTALIVLEFPYP